MSTVYLQQFPSYSNHNFEKSSFLRTPAFIFLFALRTPLWQSRKTLHECKDNSVLETPRSMCLSIFNSFPSYWNRKCKKSAFRVPQPTYLFPWRRPCDYHAICCMDGKTIQCLPNLLQYVAIYLQYFSSYTMLK